MMRFRGSVVLGGAVLGLVCAAPVRADSVVVSPETQIVPPDQMSRLVEVQDVRASGDTVSGTVVNASGKPVRDVQLLVKYVWLWNDERHPGNDSPGRADYYTLPGELAPGERRDFTYRPDEPLPHRRDGRFNPTVQVSGAMEVTPSEGPRASAGTAP
jgi:hypothetical protein